MYKEVLIQITNSNNKVTDKFTLGSATVILTDNDILNFIEDNRISWIANKNAKFVEVWEVKHEKNMSYMGSKILNYNLAKQFKF